MHAEHELSTCEFLSSKLERSVSISDVDRTNVVDRPAIQDEYYCQAVHSRRHGLSDC